MGETDEGYSASFWGDKDFQGLVMMIAQTHELNNNILKLWFSWHVNYTSTERKRKLENPC